MKNTTVIEDITALGPELSEEQLALVSGGVLRTDRSSLVIYIDPSDGSQTGTGTDADF